MPWVVSVGSVGIGAQRGDAYAVINLSRHGRRVEVLEHHLVHAEGAVFVGAAFLTTVEGALTLAGDPPDWLPSSL
jgi:hypothetical protein